MFLIKLQWWTSVQSKGITFGIRNSNVKSKLRKKEKKCGLKNTFSFYTTIIALLSTIKSIKNTIKKQKKLREFRGQKYMLILIFQNDCLFYKDIFTRGIKTVK